MKLISAIVLLLLTTSLIGKRIPGTRNFNLGQYVYDNLPVDNQMRWQTAFISPTTARKTGLKSLHADAGKFTFDICYDTLGRCLREWYWSIGVDKGQRYEIRFSYDSTLAKKGIKRISTRVFQKMNYSWVKDSLILTYDSSGKPLRMIEISVVRDKLVTIADYKFLYHKSCLFDYVNVCSDSEVSTRWYWTLKYNKYSGELWYKLYYYNTLQDHVSSDFKLMPGMIEKDSMQYPFQMDNALSNFSEFAERPYAFCSLWHVSYDKTTHLVYLDDSWPVGISYDANGRLSSVFKLGLIDSTMNGYLTQEENFLAQFQYQEDGLPISLTVKNTYPDSDLYSEKYFVYRFRFEFYR